MYRRVSKNRKAPEIKTIEREMKEKCYICGRSPEEFVATFDLSTEAQRGDELPAFQDHSSMFYTETVTGKRVIPVKMETSESHHEERFFYPKDVKENRQTGQREIIRGDKPITVIMKKHYENAAAQAYEYNQAWQAAEEAEKDALPPECWGCYSQGVHCGGVRCFNATNISEIRLNYTLCPVCMGLLNEASRASEEIQKKVGT